MFEKQKAELIAGKIQKYAGGKVRANTIKEGGEWIIDVEVLEDIFTLEFKGIKVRFTRKQDGSI